MTEPTNRDREVSELARNSGSRAERDGIVAAYREGCTRVALSPLTEVWREMALHATNSADCPYEAAAVSKFAERLRLHVATAMWGTKKVAP